MENKNPERSFKGEGHNFFLTRYIKGHGQMQFICMLNIAKKDCVS